MTASNEFPFEFRLQKGEPVPEQDLLQHFVLQQLESLLDIVVLTEGGRKVEVDGFMWVKDAYTRHGDTPTTPFSLTDLPNGKAPKAVS